MKTHFFCGFMVLALVAASSAYAGKVELSTYYPAPYGEYSDMKAKKLAAGEDLPNREGDMRLAAQTGDPADPDNPWPAGAPGQVAYSETTKKLYYSDGTAWVASSGASSGDSGNSGTLGAPDKSATISLAAGATETWTHNLGTTNYMVYMECIAIHGTAHNNGVGSDVYDSGLYRGAYWTNKGANSIAVYRAHYDEANGLCPQVRLRLWKWE